MTPYERRIAELEASLKHANNHADTLLKQVESMSKELEEFRKGEPRAIEGRILDK
jgi:prefoldin subunit 5